MGFSLGLFGAGGAILTVPILVYIFNTNPLEATHASLFIVGMVALFGIWKNFGEILKSAPKAVAFALPSLAGMVLMRSLILKNLPAKIGVTEGLQISLSAIVLGTFALFMVAASWAMIYLKIKKTEMNISSLALAVRGLLTGLLSGFVGAGGGFIIVPSLLFSGSFTIKEATQISLAIIFVNSSVGFLVSGSTLSISWSILGIILAGAILGLNIGQRYKSSCDSEKLKPAFGYFIFSVGIYIIVRTLYGAN